MTMNIKQTMKLAAKCGWDIYERPGLHFNLQLHKPDIAKINVRFSAGGRLTGLEAWDFTTGTRHAPKRYKADRLSHFITDGLAGLA